MLQTREATEPAVGTCKSILKKSGVRVMKSSIGKNMAVGKGEPWEKGHTWTTNHLGEWVFAGPELGWYRRDTTSLSEHRACVGLQP